MTFSLIPARLKRDLDLCWAPLFGGAFLAILIIQLFLPPSVGLSDNGDFIRLTADLRLTPNYPVNERFFEYFTPDYLKPGGPAVWANQMRATGRLAVRAAGWIASVKPAGHFDVRWLGFVHLCVYLLCFGAFLFTLRGTPARLRWLLPAVAVWIYSDVFYADYLNSFYLDAMGFLCFLLAMAGLFGILNLGSPVWALLAFFFGSVGFACAKPINGPIGVVLGVSVVVVSWLQLRGLRRTLGMGAALCCSLAGIAIMAATPPHYQYPALVDVVMLRIATAPGGQSSLPEFGLLPSDMRYVGMDAFRGDGPGRDTAFQTRFEPHASDHLLRWYAKHPGATLAFLWDDLLHNAPKLRPLRDLEKQYRAQDSRSRNLCSWSDLRSQCMRAWPIFIPLLYLAAVLISIATIVSPRWARYRGYGLFVVVLVSQGIVQFCAGSLLDATETPRHLFMFQVTTDALILTLLAGLLWLTAARAHRQPVSGRG